MRRWVWLAMCFGISSCQNTTAQNRVRPVPREQKANPSPLPSAVEASPVVSRSASTTAPNSSGVTTGAPPILIIPASVKPANAREYIEGKLSVVPGKKSDPPDTVFHGKVLFDAKDKSRVRVGVSLRIVFDTNPCVAFETPVKSVTATERDIEATYTYKDRRGVSKDNALLHGAKGVARILVREWQAPTTIPSASVHSHETGTTVLSVVNEGGTLRARRKTVVIQGSADVERVWPTGANQLVVESGLKGTELVVLDSEDDVRDGAEVRIIPVLPHRTGNPQDECNALRFRKNGDTVLDRRTNLVWERVNSSKPMTFSLAEAYCAKRKMRLPTVPEAASMAANDNADSALDLCAFENHGDQHWTGSVGEYVNTRWTLSWLGTSPSAQLTDGEASVRCVQALPPSEASSFGSPKP